MRRQAKIAQLLRAIGDELKCPICLSVFGSDGNNDKPCITTCSHTFCRECLLTALATKQLGHTRMQQQHPPTSCCPLCKSPVNKRALCTDERMADVAAAFMRLRQAYESTFQIPFSQAVVALQRQQRSAQHRESNDDLSQRFPHPVKPSTAKKSSSAKQSLPIDKQQHRLFVVLTTSGLNNVEDYSLVRAHCKRNGWQFVKAFTDLSTRPVTHLIVQPAESGMAVRRTMKYLQALAFNAWILSIEWIKQCSAAGSWLDEKPFEIRGDLVCPNSNAPEIARFSQRRLFADFVEKRVTFGPPESYQSVDLDSVRTLAIQCGLQVVDYKQIDCCNNFGDVMIILCGIEVTDRQRKQLPTACALSITWLLDCIALQNAYLNMEPYKLI